LASGIGVIASLTLFFLSLTPKVNQPMTATIAILLCGTLLGYLRYSFNPAKIFLGESGSVLIGFILGALSIILGGKIATALLVMGVPIMDVAWVILRRLWYGTSPFKADRKHLHFRLLDIGLSQRQAVLILYLLSALFGFTAVFLQSMGKLIALLILSVTMFALALATVVIYKRKNGNLPEKEKPELDSNKVS
jgi:UDP-GlcNAc:undecaprenyl-phosphate GlcNAc-1-phosphate transferase